MTYVTDLLLPYLPLRRKFPNQFHALQNIRDKFQVYPNDVSIQAQIRQKSQNLSPRANP